MKVLIVLALFGMAFAQDIEGDESVVAKFTWAENDNTPAGAYLIIPYSNVGEGSCSIEFPTKVLQFHPLNGHIVPGDGSNSLGGRYQIAAPAEWEAANGTIEAVLIFQPQSVFNISNITFSCAADADTEITVGSFPQNTLMKEASSNIHYRPGFTEGMVLTITLPSPVSRFNFTTMDSEYTVERSDDMTVFTLSGFKNDESVTDMKEVAFSLDYLINDPTDPDRPDWFSAADITVTVSSAGEDEAEEEPVVAA